MVGFPVKKLGRSRSFAEDQARHVLWDESRKKGLVRSFRGMITIPKYVLGHIHAGGSGWVT